MNILTEADRLIHAERNKTYGHPLENHGRTAALWSAYLGVQITAEQVCYLNILQKVSRTASGVPHRDTDVDIAGYAGNVEMIQDKRAAQQKLIDAALPRVPTAPELRVIVAPNTRGVHIDPLSVIRDLDSSGPLKWD